VNVLEVTTKFKKQHKCIKINVTHYYLHSGKVTPKKEISIVLRCVHTVISNAKRMILDIYHWVDDDFSQNYLNEYVYQIKSKTLQMLL
jgi:polynucleotide 5'-kinase involved in rRNA processing